MSVWQAIVQHIESVTHDSIPTLNPQPIHGGCINRAYRLQGLQDAYFVKLNQANRVTMFESEAVGLHEIAKTHTVRVPHPICYGTASQHSYLVLEYLPLKSLNMVAMERLGRQLAALHQVTRPEFGWIRDNTIGATPQLNTPCRNWATFWCQHRLGFQLNLAVKNGHHALAQDGERLIAMLMTYFTTQYQPVAALLHGDLWGGNAAGVDNEPVIFDPAVYYGDRETDVAMTELFGGFSEHFYAAYREVYPLSADYAARRTVYNLYHVLNHLNLFGGGYYSQAKRMLDEALALFGDGR